MDGASFCGKVLKVCQQGFLTPETTKSALGGFCRCFELVGRGNLNPCSISLVFIANILFCYSLEYQLEYRVQLYSA